MARLCSYRRKQLQKYFALCFISFAIFFLFSHWWILIHVGYLLRPLWDTPDRPWQIIPHYYSSKLSMEKLCRLHDWAYISDAEKRPKVFDVIIFSNELDLLEIRLHELYDVVDKFIIVESNLTFTGNPKDLVFRDSKDRFGFAQSKIIHSEVELKQLPRGDEPFYNEAISRDYVTFLLNEPEISVKPGDLILMTDVDELPSAHTVQLLKSCRGIPKSTHLQLKNYIYSFEFFYDLGSWRAHVEIWDPGVTKYHHERLDSEDILLAEAGLHCSWCFRNIEDFIFKMKSYSHADRARHPGLFSPQRIQKVICEGSDIFDMFPEAFSFKELISKWGKMDKLSSAVNLPSYILENNEKFRFLLPGGCVRGK